LRSQKKISTPDPPPINRRFPAFFVSFTYLYIPPTSPQIFAQCSHKCAKFFHMECNDAHRWLLLPDTSHTQKRNFRPRTYDKKSINRTIGMLVKHLLKFAQYSKVWQELSSCNTCKFWRKREKTSGWGRKIHNIFTHSQPSSLKLSHNMKQRTLYLTQALASLSVHNDHRCDGGHCAETTPPPHSRHGEQKKRGGEFLRRFLFCFVLCFWQPPYLFSLS
jgi:hypothetical protein